MQNGALQVYRSHVTAQLQKIPCIVSQNNVNTQFPKGPFWSQSSGRDSYEEKPMWN